MDDKLDPRALAHQLFGSVMCAALDELRLGVLRWDHNHHDVPAVIELAGRRAWARDVRRLHLGDIDDRDDNFSIDMAHHVVGDVGKAISKAFPRLEWLKIHSGAQDWRGAGETLGLGKLALPELRALTIETCAMSKPRLRHVLAAALPKLERLELWFGSENQGANCTVKDLKPLLDGKLFPKLRHLGLCNAEFADELAAVLPGAPIASKLETLDLSKGTLGDDAARALAASAGRFARLATLSLDDSWLGAAAIKAVRAGFAGRTVSSKNQQNPAEYEGERYVSVGE